MREIEKECLLYFQKPGFHRIMVLMKEKYYSLGHIGGTLHLIDITEEEKRDLNGFLRKNLSAHQNLSVSVATIAKLLADTKFSSISLKEVIELYFHEELTSKKVERADKEQERSEFFFAIMKRFIGTIAESWMKEVLHKKSGIYQTLIQRYDKDQIELEKQLNHVMSALCHLPVKEGKHLRLPVFSGNITQDPHAFDENKEEFTLLLHGICTVLYMPYHTAMNAQERMEVLYAAGIQKDDVSNYTTVFRMYGFCQNQEYLGWREFAEADQPIQLTLMNLNDVTKIMAEDYIFVVENPSVFSTLVEYCIAHHITNISLMCTYGQLRISSFLVLDLLIKSNHSFYYAGDMDPEGLQIAQKLLQRYEKQCRLWHYHQADYETAKSDKRLTINREHKLNSIARQELQEIKECLLSSQVCGYQEQLLSHYCKDLLELCSNER